jgi:photosystem II stability/assembly factor-like uncharacterized protein
MAKSHRLPANFNPWMVWFATFVALVFACNISFADPPSSPGEMLEIAELSDVFFLDADQGWAVGDQGVIWQTQNGGRSWNLVDSPATCRLESIHFCDPSHGWIVGGWIHPLTHKSSAVVLHTENGGRKWVRLETPNIPGLKWVWFRDRRRGWAAGNSSSMYPAGFVYTEDGGRTWNEMPITQPQSIVAATLGDQQQLLAINRHHGPIAIWGNQPEPAAMRDLVARRLRDITWQGTQGWLVGDRGTVLTSVDGGRSWNPPPGKLPEDIADQFDWHTVESLGTHCWIAGSPGTAILYSPDRGATWQIHKTRHRLPLHRIRFLDEQHGWAVGSFGCILGTRDRGRNWRVQRRGAERASVAGMFSTAEQVPWELYASAAAESGHCCVAELLNRTPDSFDKETSSEERSHAAAVAVGAGGCHTAWDFPVGANHSVMQLDRIIAPWGATNRSPMQALEEHLVRQIRIWQPDVIICDTISSSGRQPLAHLVSQITLRAAQQAGDPASCADQIALAGLEPWSAKKVFAMLPSGQQSGCVIDLERLAVHLGCSLADYSAISRGLVSQRRNLTPSMLALRLVRSTAVHDNASRDLFAGIVPGAIGESRRDAVANTGVTIESLGRALDEKRVIQLISHSTADVSDSSSVTNQIDQLIRGRSRHHAGILTQRLAQHFVDQGQLTTAAAIETVFAERFPEHIFAESSLIWLLRSHGSAEWLLAFDKKSPATTSTDVAIRLPPADSSANSATPFKDAKANSVQQASFTVAEPVPAIEQAAAARLQQAARWGEMLQMRHASAYLDPAIQFQLASIQRRLGNEPEAARILSGLNRASLAPAWKRCLRAEQSLVGQTIDPSIWTIKCSSIDTKPYLDGKLDEPFWSVASVAELRAMSGQTDLPAEVRFCQDEQFLYVAARCAKDPNQKYTSTAQRRTRDANLELNDRIELSIDTDTDYTSAFRLTVDYRGWTHDSCDEHSGWNPTWHVAANGSDSDWSVEAAIPLEALQAGERVFRQPWAISVRRPLPSGEVNAWPQPLGQSWQPCECGYLFFP